MTKTYLKRIAAPKTWPIRRKQSKFIIRPKPRGTPLGLTLPVAVVLRDMLGLVENARQAGRVMKTQDVLVNGRKVYGASDSIGFMDILTVGGKTYRILINKNNQLTVEPAKKGEEFVVARVRGKTSLRGGKTQLNFRGGQNMIVGKNAYKVGDSVCLADGKEKEHFPLEKGAAVLISGGSHIGTVGKIEKVDGNMITVSSGKETFQTAKRYAYVVGKDKPAITITG